MNYIDLFSGIGGFALGAYWAGMKFKKHYFSEIDPYCIELYKKRFPDAIELGDITKINWKNLPKDNYIVTGGFPCQDISIAGKGEGIHGKRSNLWFTMSDTIRILRPRFTIIENVSELPRNGLNIVLSNLAEIGYDAEWQMISALDMGAPHLRKRIWIVTYPCDNNYEEKKGLFYQLPYSIPYGYYDVHLKTLIRNQNSLMKFDPIILDVLLKEGLMHKGKIYEQPERIPQKRTNRSKLWLIPSTVQIEFLKDRREKENDNNK